VPCLQNSSTSRCPGTDEGVVELGAQFSRPKHSNCTTGCLCPNLSTCVRFDISCLRPFKSCVHILGHTITIGPLCFHPTLHGASPSAVLYLSPLGRPMRTTWVMPLRLVPNQSSRARAGWQLLGMHSYQSSAPILMPHRLPLSTNIMNTSISKLMRPPEMI